MLIFLSLFIASAAAFGNGPRLCIFTPGIRYARSIPRAHTPFNVSEPNIPLRCGYKRNGTSPQTLLEDVLRQPLVLADCTEPIDPRGWDLRGVYQAELPDGTALPSFTRYEQCGNRIVVTGGGVVHDQFITNTVNGGTSDVATPGLPDACQEFTAIWNWGEEGPAGQRSVRVRRTQDPSSFALRYQIADGLIGLQAGMGGNPLPVPPLQRRLDSDFLGNPIGLGNQLVDCQRFESTDWVLTED